MRVTRAKDGKPSELILEEERELAPIIFGIWRMWRLYQHDRQTIERAVETGDDCDAPEEEQNSGFG
jgi:hypothetical protein